MPNDRGPDDATVNEEAPDSATDAGSDKEGSAPADADEVREEAKEEIARAAESEPDRHEAQEGPKATPTQHDAEAATAAGTPSPEAVAALKRKLAKQREDEQDGSGGESDDKSHRTAKEMVADGEAPLAPLPGRAEPADKDVASPADPDHADEVQEDQEQTSEETA